MSVSSGRNTTSDDSCTASPDSLLYRNVKNERYKTCYYHNGTFCCSKICCIVVLLAFTTVTALLFTVSALSLDNWAGMTTDPKAILDLPDPRLGPNYLDYVMFNETIVNDKGTMYRYMDDSNNNVRTVTTRYGMLSHCKTPVSGPQLANFKTPWTGAVCRADWNQFQCPIVLMRSTKSEARVINTRGEGINGCIARSKVCDGTLDCPTGHDEVGCTMPTICPPTHVQCEGKNLCIPADQVCDGFNDCGMFEDERNCCGRTGFIRCGDGSCVIGDRCDARAHCFDSSDEMECPSPALSSIVRCRSGQLIESTFKCEALLVPSFQCTDLSDETDCEFKPEQLAYNPGLKSEEYDDQAKCFKQAFTFQTVNQTILHTEYPDKRTRELHETYDFSKVKLAILGCIGVMIALSAISLIVLACIGRVMRRCRPMRHAFIILACIYAACIVQAIITGSFWVKYTASLNDVIQNPSESGPYEQAAMETLRASGALVTLRLSAHLIFYNCGFFALAFILSVVASCVVRSSSCHNDRVQEYTGKYRQCLRSNETIAMHEKMLPPYRPQGPGSDSLDESISTPDQIVSPQRSFRTLEQQRDLTHAHSCSDSVLRGLTSSRANTYISYKDPLDTLSRADNYSTLTVRTLDRQSIKHTQV